MNRKRIILAILVLLFVIGLIIIWNNSRKGTLELTAPTETPNNSVVTVTVLPTDSEGQTLELQPGQTKRLRLSPGKLQVNGAAGDIKSTNIVTVERGKTTQLRTPSGQQHNIELLGLNARFCPVVLPDKVYSYNCQSDGPIIKHLTASNTTIFGGQLFSLLEPLSSGLLGFYADNLIDLQYLDLQTETIRPVTLPSNIQSIMKSEITQVITSGDPADARFVLFFPSISKLYLFDSLSDNEPVELALGEGVVSTEAGRIITVDLTPGGALVYAGNDSDGTDGEDQETTEAAVLPAYLFEYDNLGAKNSTIKLEDGFDAESLSKIADNYYLAEEQGGVFEFYFLNSGIIQSVLKMADVTDWVNFSDKTYVVSGRSLYLFEPIQGGTFSLNSVFTSRDLPVSEAFGTVRGLVFTGFAGASSSAPLNIYRLLDTQAQPGAVLPGVPTNTETQFVDLGDLLEFGVTSEQLGALRTAFGNFAATLSDPIEQVIIGGAAAVPRDRFSQSTADTVTFTAFIDGDRYTAKLEYSSLVTIRLYLYNADGTLVYDSQAISS